MILNLGKTRNVDLKNVVELIKVYFQMIDNLQGYKPSTKQLEKFKKNRIDFVKKKKKEEIEEQNQNKREEKLKNMTEQEREKYKERKMKRIQSKLSRKVKAISKV